MLDSRDKTKLGRTTEKHKDRVIQKTEKKTDLMALFLFLVIICLEFLELSIRIL